MNETTKIKRRWDVWDFKEGSIDILCPEFLSRESLELFEEYLQIFLRIKKRQIEAAEIKTNEETTDTLAALRGEK